MFKLRKLSLLFILSPVLLGGFSSVPVVTNPTIKLNGPNPYVLEVGTAYNELGATAEDAEDGVLTNTISITGVVNNTQLGNYYIQYAVTDSDSNTTIRDREVRVVDTTPPIITRTGNAVITLEVGDIYSEQGASATDNYDTSVSVVVGGDTVDTTTVGTYTVTYNATDTSNKAAAQVIRTVNVVDTTTPTITINSPNPLIISLGGAFSVPSYTTSDNSQGTVTVTVTENVNVNTTGAYTVNYSASDPSGNTNSEVLNVYVGPEANAGTDTSICKNNEIYIGSSSANPSYTYQWTSSPAVGTADGPSIDNPGQGYTRAVPQVTTLFTLRVTTTIGAVNVEETDDILVTVVDNPEASVIADTEICLGESIAVGATAVSGSTYQWSSSPAGFSSTIANPTFSPTNTTTFTLVETKTASPNCTETNSVTITVAQPATIYAGPNESICESDVTAGYRLDKATSSVTLASEIDYHWVALGGDGTFDDSTILNPIYYPGSTDISNGSVILELTGTPTGVCSITPSTSQTTLTIVPALIADAGPSPVELCANSSYTLAASVQNYAFIQWTSNGSAGTLINANTANPTYTPSASDVINGGVTLTMTATPLAGCATPIPDTVNIQLTPEPEAFAGANKVICEGDNVILSDASMVNGASFTWTSSNGGQFTTTGVAPSDFSYIPNNQDILAGGTVLTLTVTGQDSCGSVTNISNTSVTIHKVPEVDAGPANQTLCEGPNSINGASVNYGDTLQWSGGDGTFTGGDTLSPIYTPGPTDLINGTVTLTLTATAFNSCSSPISDSVTFQVNAAPIANAGPNASVCANNSFTLSGASASNYSSLTWSSSGTGAFDSTAAEKPVYTPSLGDISSGFVRLTMTLQQDGCATVSEDMELSIVPEATANAGTDLTVCQGEEAIISNASAQNYSSILWVVLTGSGTLQNETTIAPTYVPDPNETGTVTLRLTAQPNTDGVNNCGPPATDTMKITIVAEPTANAGPNQTICEGDDIPLVDPNITATNYNQLVWSAPGGDGSFTDINNLNPTYTPGTNDRLSGQVTLRLEALPNSPCATSATSEMLLSITRIPLVDAGPASIDYCETDTVISLNNSTVLYADNVLWTTSGSGSFSPSASATNPQYFPLATDIANGSVVLTLTGLQNPGNCGAQSSDDILINFIELPTADAGPDATICDDNSYTLGQATATNYASVTWTSSGTGSFDNNNLPNPTYTPSAQDIALGSPITLTVTAVGIDPCQVTESDSMDLTLAPSPEMEVGNDRFLCENTDLSINLTAGVDVSHVDTNSYQWTSSGTGTFLPTNTLSTVYQHSPEDLAGGVPIQITLTAQPLAPCATPISDSFMLTLVENPTATVGPTAITICDTGHTFNQAVATNYQSIQWTNLTGTGAIQNSTSENATYIPNQADINAGTVTLRFTAKPINPCGAIAQEDVVVTIQPSAEVYAGDDAVICEGEPFVVATATEANTTSLLWSSPTGGTFSNGTGLAPTFTPTPAEIAAGQATLVLTGQPESPCTTPVSDTMILIIQNQPDVEAGVNTTICEGDTYQTNTATLVYSGGSLWTTSGTGSFANSTDLNTTYTPSAADITNGFVELKLTANAIGPCTGTIEDVVTVTIAPKATVSIVPDAATICADDTYTFSASQIIDINVSSFNWITSGDGTFFDATEEAPTYTPGPGDIINGSVTLTVQVNADSACSNPTDSDSFTLTIDPKPTIDLSAAATKVCFGSQLTINSTINNYQTITWEILSGGGTLVSGGNSENPIYEPAVDSEIVRLKVSATGINPCSVTETQELVINVTGLPEITAFPADSESCDILPYVISGTLTNSKESSVLWTTSGSGTFDNPANSNPMYTPTLADVTTGYVDLTMTAIAASPCDATVNDADTFRLTLTKAPTVNAGADDSLCIDSNYTISDASEANTLSYSWTSNGTGTWQNQNTLNATYIPSDVDKSNGFVILTLTGSGNGSCNPAVDQKRIDIIPTPVVDLIPSADYCTNEPGISLSATALENYSTVAWFTSSTSGTFSATNTLTTTYYPSADDYAAGQVTITLRANPLAPCTSFEEDTMTLNFVQAPEVTAGVDQIICEDQSANLNATVNYQNSLLWTTSGTGTFENGVDTISNPVYIPSITDIQNGFVTLTLTAIGDATCAPTTDDMRIDFAPNPKVTIGTDLTYCENQTVTLSDVVIQDASSILWETTALGTLTNVNTANPTYTPANNELGPVTLKLTLGATSPCTVTQTFTKVINYVANPDANAGPDLSYCEVDGDITITGATTSTGATIAWNIIVGTGSLSNGATISPTYSPSTQDYINGEVRLELRALGTSGCADATDELIINLTPTPLVNAGTDASICQNETFTTTNASVSYSSNFAWSTPDGLGILNTSPNDLNASYTPAVGEVGTIRLLLTAQSDNGCPTVVQDEILITINPPATADAGVDQILCEGDNVSLTGTATNSTNTLWISTGSGIFVPDASSLNAQYQPSPSDYSSGNITLTLAVDGIGSCSTVTDNMTVAFAPTPNVYAGADAEICVGDDYNLVDATLTNGQNIQWSIVAGDGSFIGSVNSVNPTYSPGPQDLIDGAATLRLSADGIDPCQNTTSDDIVITITPLPTLSVVPNFAACEGEISITGTQATNYSTVQWQVIQGTGTLNVADPLAPIYTTSATDVVNGTVTLRATANGTGACSINSVEKEIILTISESGTVDAGSSMASCEATAYTFNNNAQTDNVTNLFWTHDGTGTITSGQGTLTPTYTPASGETGTITFTLEADQLSPCAGKISDTVSLEFIANPQADAGSSFTTCEGSFTLNGVVSNTNSFQWSGGAGVFSPNNNSTLTPTYTPTAQEISQGFVSIILTADAIAPCNIPATSLVTVYFDDAVSVDAGPATASVCAGDSYVLSTASVSNFSSFTWSTSGSGTFSPNESDQNPTYTPSANDIASGQVTLTLNVTGSGSCSTASDDLVLTIDPLPSITTAASTLMFCDDVSQLSVSGVSAVNYNPSSLKWITNGAGFFIDDNALNPEYVLQGADFTSGVILYASVNGVASMACSSAVAQTQIAINFSTAVSVYAGPAAEICSNETFAITNATVSPNATILWSTSGTGTFSNQTDLNPIYTPSASDIVNGSIELTITGTGDPVCTPASDSITLSINQSPEISLAQNIFNVCTSETEVAITGVGIQYEDSFIWSHDGQGSFKVSDTALNQVYVPAGNDFSQGVTLTLTANGVGSCAISPVVEQIKINFYDQVQVDAGTDQAGICANENFQISNAVATNAASFEWSSPGADGVFSETTTNINPIYIPSPTDISNGTVTLRLTAYGLGTCADVYDEITLTIDPVVDVYAGADVVLCASDTSYTLSDAFANNYQSVSWSKSDGTTTGFTDVSSVNPQYLFTAAEKEAGFITLILKGYGANNCSTVTEDSVTISFTPSVSLSAGSDGNVCYGSSFVVSDATITSGSYDAIQWTTTGTGTLLFANTLTPKYLPSAGDLASANKQVTLTMTVTPKSVCGATPVQDAMTLTINEAIIGTASIQGNAAICEGETITYTLTGLSGASTYNWTVPSGASIISGDGTNQITLKFDTFNQNTIATLAVVAANACPNTDTTATLDLQIFADPELQLLSGSSQAKICTDELMTPIVYELKGGANDASIEWFESGIAVPTPSGLVFLSNGTQAEISGTPDSVTNETVYTYKLTASTLGCTATAIETGELTLLATPKASLGPTSNNTQVLCEGAALQPIEYSLSNATTYSFNWTTIQPSGFTVVYDNTTNTLVISGNADNVSQQTVYNYTLIPQNQTNGCSGSALAGQITVNADSELMLSSANNIQTICEGTAIGDIIYSLGGDATNVSISGAASSWMSANVNAGVVTISGSPTANITATTDYNYSITTTGGSCLEKTLNGTIEVTPSPSISLNTSSVGTTSQTVCEGQAIQTISLDLNDLGSNSNVIVSNLPVGVNYNVSGNTLTIAGTPTSVNTFTAYNYLVEVRSGDNNCTGTFNGTIQVQAQDEITIQPGTNSSGSYCFGDVISPITYNFAGGTTGAVIEWTENGAVITGDPSGISASINSNSITISGSLTANVSTQTEYGYTITSVNSGICSNTMSVSGSLTLDPLPTLILNNLSGQINQQVCENIAINDIVYDVSGANTVQIDWDVTPSGINSQFNVASGQFTISGTVQNINADTSYNYTIVAENQLTGCTSVNRSGTLTVFAAHELNLSSGSTTASQEFCEGTPLPNNIIYDFGGGATSAKVVGLDNTGLNWIVIGNQLTISGTPTIDISTQQTLNYSVETVGNICGSTSLTGFIRLNPDTKINVAASSGALNQTRCEGIGIDNIVFDIPEAYWAYEVSGLPNGVSPSYDATTKQLTISGTPSNNITTDQTYSYLVKTINQTGCDSPMFTGNIVVVAGPELTNLGTSGTLNQSVCIGSDIDKISIRFANGTTPYVTNLPNGLNTQVIGDVFEITGNITQGGQYAFDIATANSVCVTPISIGVQIDVLPNFSILNQVEAGYKDDLSLDIGASQVKNIACYGDRSGEIKVEMSDNTYTYYYAWTGPNNYSNTTTSNHIQNLLPGTYTVNVGSINANTCSITETYIVQGPDPLQIQTNEIVPVSCDGTDDGIISIQATGGNTDFYKQLTWYYFEEETSCFTYTLTLRDADNDGIYDIIDADIDNDGTTDAGKTDANADGIEDSADTDLDGVVDPNYVLSNVSYQNCDSGQFVSLSLVNGDFSASGSLVVCARPSSVSVEAKLDHDLDPTTPLIGSVTVGGGTASCYSGSWIVVSSLTGSSYASKLKEGLYKVKVEEVEFSTGNVYCEIEETFEVTKNEISYANVSVSDTYCLENSGTIDLDVRATSELLYFYYNGVKVPETNVSVIAENFSEKRYRLSITSPVDLATLEIQDEFGCGIAVNTDLLDITVNDPSFTYTSPEYERYGTISERTSVSFKLSGINSYDSIVWDFGDASATKSGSQVTHIYQAEGTYTVTLTAYNASGCFKTTTQEIVVGKGYSLIMPNTFTPNNDNINDRIGPSFTGLKEVNFYVYNKSGVLIYEESVTENSLAANSVIKVLGWDGSNSDPNSNYYVYKIIATRLNDEIITETGTIFLLK
jgi:hypothetical protein